MVPASTTAPAGERRPRPAATSEPARRTNRPALGGAPEHGAAARAADLLLHLDRVGALRQRRAGEDPAARARRGAAGRGPAGEHLERDRRGARRAAARRRRGARSRPSSRRRTRGRSRVGDEVLGERAAERLRERDALGGERRDVGEGGEDPGRGRRRGRAPAVYTTPGRASATRGAPPGPRVRAARGRWACRLALPPPSRTGRRGAAVRPAFPERMASDPQDRRRAALMEQLRRAAGKPLSLRELMQRAKLHPGERTEVKRVAARPRARGAPRPRREAVRAAGAARRGPPAGRRAGARSRRCRRGRAARRPGARRGRGGEVLGTLKKHRDGFGFVARLDRKGDDVFVPPGEAARALDGDLVRRRDRAGARRADRRPDRRGGGAPAAAARRHLPRPRPRRASSCRRRRARGRTCRCRRPTRPRDGEVVKVALEPGSGRLAGHGGRGGRPARRAARRGAQGRLRAGLRRRLPGAGRRPRRESVPDHVRSEDRARPARPHRPAARHHRRRGRARLRRRRLRRAARGAEGQGALPAGGRHRRRGALRPRRAPRSTPRRSGAGRASTSRCRCCRCCPERLSNGICSLNPEVDRLCMVADMVIDEQRRDRARPRCTRR